MFWIIDDQISIERVSGGEEIQLNEEGNIIKSAKWPAEGADTNVHSKFGSKLGNETNHRTNTSDGIERQIHAIMLRIHALSFVIQYYAVTSHALLLALRGLLLRLFGSFFCLFGTLLLGVFHFG